MAKGELKKGRIKPEDWPEGLYFRSGTYKRKNGLPRIDPGKQAYSSQPYPPRNTVNEIDGLNKSTPDFSEPWFSREPSWRGRDAKKCREYLGGLSDEEIINIYYRLRDTKVIWGGSYYYPYIKNIFLTPFEREKDRREIDSWQKKYDKSEVARWSEYAKDRSCVWWIENHLMAKHTLKSCMSCGTCTAACPSAEFYDYNPRLIMETVQSKDEDKIIELLKSDTIWYCGQCGTCKLRCPRGNNTFALVSSLRQLSQLKGYHINSARGKQQYTARHLWGGNYWNRGSCMYFRNIIPRFHLDFGPRFIRYVLNADEMYRRVGGCPDMDGSMPGRKVHPDTLQQIRRCWQVGGTLELWQAIEKFGQEHAKQLNVDIDDYFYTV